MIALLAGATGVVGREILRLLLAEPAYERVIVIARRAVRDAIPGLGSPPKLEERLVDFERIEEHADWFRADQVFSALGTTMRQAGSRERFRRIDFDYQLTVARLGLAGGARHFLLVSALGATARSRVFYSRVKGELENAVLALPFRSVTIVRPSLLVGERAEKRLGEEIGKRLAFLTPARFRPVAGAAVARTLVRAALADAPGRRIVESREIR